jgi:hypothetical protein
MTCVENTFCHVSALNMDLTDIISSEEAPMPWFYCTGFITRILTERS